MVTFCIIHIGNRKIFLKHHSPQVPTNPFTRECVLILGGEGGRGVCQYTEMSTSKIPFHNPIVMKYYYVLACFSLDYEYCISVCILFCTYTVSIQ